jgi:hypothetical protein
MRFFPDQDTTASLYVMYISAMTDQLLCCIHVFQLLCFIHYLGLDYSLWLCKQIVISRHALKLVLSVFCGHHALIVLLWDIHTILSFSNTMTA